MGYAYTYDDTPVGGFRLTRKRYEILQSAFGRLRDALEEWNAKALAHGAESRPYGREVKYLERMIAWADKRLQNPDVTEVVFDGIAVGSLRYAKAALLFALQRGENERANKELQGLAEGFQDGSTGAGCAAKVPGLKHGCARRTGR